MVPTGRACAVTPAPPTGDLGENVAHLRKVVDRCGCGATLVELGVDKGVSTRVLLAGADERDHVVHGVDVTFRHLPWELLTNPRLRRIRSDSVTAGRRWTGGPVDLLYVDTLHAAPQVLCELHAWLPHLRPGGFVVVHDTAWPDDERDLGWHPRVVEAGASWPTPDAAVASYFGLVEAFGSGKHVGFRHVDGRLSVDHHPASYGMTLIQVHELAGLGDAVDWPAAYAERERMLRLVLGDQAVDAGDVDLGTEPPRVCR